MRFVRISLSSLALGFSRSTQGKGLGCCNCGHPVLGLRRESCLLGGAREIEDALEDCVRIATFFSKAVAKLWFAERRLERTR